MARKHISWYTKGLVGSAAFRAHMNTLDELNAQKDAVHRFFGELGVRSARLQYETSEQSQEEIALAA